MRKLAVTIVILSSVNGLAGCGGSVFGRFHPVTAYDAMQKPLIVYLPDDQPPPFANALANMAGRTAAGLTGGLISQDNGGTVAMAGLAWLWGRGRSKQTETQLIDAQKELTRHKVRADLLANVNGNGQSHQTG